MVDLSHVPYNEKVDYLNSLLPMLASLRQTTGLPHRIVVDEAHYFIHAPNAQQLLDLTRPPTRWSRIESPSCIRNSARPLIRSWSSVRPIPTRCGRF